MIVSEKQIIQLMQIAHTYQNALETLYKFDQTLLSGCGLHNKVEIAKLLMTIANQQSTELKVIE